MTNSNKPLTTTPVPGAAAKSKAGKAAPAGKGKAEGSAVEAPAPAARKVTPANPVMVPRAMVWQNIALMFASLLLWTSWRFLYIRLKLGSGGDELHFRPYDVLFVVLPPCGAFCLNWYWLREQRTDVITKWSTWWAVIDLVVFGLVAFFASHPLHMWLTDLSAG